MINTRKGIEIVLLGKINKKESEIKNKTFKSLIISILVGISLDVFAENDPTETKLISWQMDMIYHPNQSLLGREARGFVTIYDGFTDAQVAQVLDDKFYRIDSMIFTGIKITETSGEVMKDNETGEYITEDDGC